MKKIEPITVNYLRSSGDGLPEVLANIVNKINEIIDELNNRTLVVKNDDKDNLDFHSLATSLKKWFSDREIEISDTHIGQLAIYIREKYHDEKQKD